MRVFAAALAAMLLAATQPAQRLHVSDVRSITIDSSWSGLGKPSTYRTTITRKGDAFVRDDGSAVTSNAIRALLRAAQETHLTEVSAANAGLTGAQLRWYLPAAEDALAGAKSDANVRAVFARTFTDPSRAQTWMSYEARTMHTDDGPWIRIRISSTRGTIALASRSYHLLMLPFEVDGGPASGAAYDARISYAIASLLPKGATNKQRLEERWLVGSWAEHVAQSDLVRKAMSNGDARERVAQVASREGLVLMGLDTSDGVSWEGHLSLANDTRLRAEVLCTPNPARKVTDGSCIRHARRRIDAIARVPWLIRALATQPKGYVVASYGDTIAPLELSDWQAKSNNPSGARYVGAHLHPVTFVRMYSQQRHVRLPYSIWVLFPDGTMGLEEYGTGLRGFPFGQKRYATLFPHHSEDLGMMQFVGLLRRPDGTWIKDRAKPK